MSGASARRITEIYGEPFSSRESSMSMYELNNKVRLVDVSQYMIENSSEFMGFVSGIISQDHDLQQMYFDNFLLLLPHSGQCGFSENT